MGKSPLNANQVKTLRKLLEEKPLDSLLLNLGVDLMLRSSDLLQLKVSDVMNESGTPKTEVKVKQKKTGKTTLDIPLSPNSIKVIKRFLSDKEQEDFIFKGQLSHLSRKPITTQQYARIVKRWLKNLLGIEDVNRYSTHSLRKTKPTVIYEKTKNVEICRRLLSHSNCTSTSQYLGIEDSDALEFARTINI
jgi:integrase